MQRKTAAVLGTTVVAAVLVLAFAVAASGKQGNGFGARLDGFQETPSILTTGHGRFHASFTGGKIEYRLSYSGLKATAQQAHIHFAQEHVAGAVVAFLCGGGGEAACPASGEVTGEILPAEVAAVPSQGITGGNIDELVRAMRAGATYVNVHTSTFGGGEIRGQIRGGGGNGNGNGKAKGKKKNGNGRDDDD